MDQSFFDSKNQGLKPQKFILYRIKHAQGHNPPQSPHKWNCLPMNGIHE